MCLTVSLYEKFILFPVATQGLQMLRQHVEALADASFLYRTNRNASHATDAKFLVYAFGIIKGDGTRRTFACACSAFRAGIAGNRVGTGAALLVWTVSGQ